MTLLRYDAAGLSASQIGTPLGITAQDRETLNDRLQAAVEAIRSRHESADLGFVACPDTDTTKVAAWAKNKLAQGWTDQVVLGIGGSSLGTRAILEAAGPLPGPAIEGGLRTHFSENIDPTSVDRLFSSLPLETTLFVVVTKSGTTLETMGQFWIAYEKVVQLVGAQKARDHFVAVTDPKVGSLREIVNTMGLESFEVPPNVGGRFSVLTHVGLVPLALAGYPIDELLDGARRVRELALRTTPADNPLAQMAAEHYLLWERGVHEVVMMSYSDQLLAMVDWFRQIWAESLGKAVDRQGRTISVGITPLKAWGVVDQHSQVQLYMEGPNTKHVIFVEVENFDADVRVPNEPQLPANLAHLGGRNISEVFEAELAGTRAALRNQGRPTSRWIFNKIGAEAVGGFIFGWEMVTAFMGELFDIDAFDQPGVELGKKIAHGLLGREGFEDYAQLATEPAEAPAGTKVNLV